MKEYNVIQGNVEYLTKILNERAVEGWIPILQSSREGHGAAIITLEREIPNPTPYR